MANAPDTSLDAYAQTRADGTDVTLRRQIARALREHGPMTIQEVVGVFPERSANSVRPRVNELLRMGCLRRDGTRENPSGHAAAVHHLTDTGRRYAAGECDPDPGPTLAERKAAVVRVARAVVAGEADVDVLQAAVETHDAAARRMEAGENL